VRVPGPDGRIAQVTRWAHKGDEIEADAQSIMLLDCQGALAPPGASREDVEREAQAMVEEYRAARRAVSGII
jgi:hypothetical protein